MKYLRNSQHISSKIEDEIIMVDVQRGEYFALNPVATRIWELLIEPHSMEEIVLTLLNEYEIDDAACRAEVSAFLERCISLGVVETTS